MKKLLVVLSILAFGSMANASICQLNADVSGMSWKIGVGGTKLSGVGTIKCLQKDGKMRTTKIVHVDMEGGGFGVGFAKFKDAKLISTGVGIVESSDALIGDFVFVKASGFLGPIGAEAGASVYFNATKQGKKGAAIPFALTSAKGAGLLLGLDIMEVTVTEVEM